MSDVVFNIAKGRVNELVRRVVASDPTNSAIIVIPIDRGATTDAAFIDLDDGAAVIAAATELSANGWDRKTLTDADLVNPTTDDTGNDQSSAFPALLWSGVTAGDSTDLLWCYDADTTGGTDSALVPLVLSAFPITADGSDVQANAGDFFNAS